MKNDLVERYIYAVTKRMPRKQQEDVTMELKGLIEDMLLERCGGEQPTEKEIREVLTELGSPYELYARYDEDADKCLIGQPYYSTYKFVLKTVLCAVVCGLVVACTILQIMDPKQWMEFLNNLIGSVCEGLLSGFAAVTLIFAVMQAKGWKMSEKLELDELPSVPKKKAQISAFECAISIGFIAVFLVVFLAVPQTFSAVFTQTGELVPIFDTQVIRSNWYILALFALAGILRESVKIVEKRYSKKVLITAAATNAVSVVMSIIWLCRADIINSEFIAKIGGIFTGNTTIITQLFGNFNILLMGLIILALVMDTIEAAVKLERE